MRILVTGASRGLGKALVTTESPHDIYEHVRTNRGKKNPRILVGDINHSDFTSKLNTFIRTNEINVLINNAGIHKRIDITKMEDREIINMINTNLVSQILITKTCLAYFQELNSGLVININSLAGKSASAGESVYCASKFGLFGFSKSLQLENLHSSIKFIDIFLGAIKSDMTKQRPDYDNLINPQELAKVILDLVGQFTSLKITEIEIRKS